MKDGLCGVFLFLEGKSKLKEMVIFFRFVA